jgi:decaprenyl-phosphate phosphoribosyltransferase
VTLNSESDQRVASASVTAPPERAATAVEESRAAPAPPRARLLRGLVREARPRQWVKNVLVLGAPIAAAKLNSTHVIKGAVIAFVAFSLAASAVYFINDIIDVEADRAHPTKRRRPIAAGIVPIPLAWGVGAVLGLAALGVAFLANVGTVAVIAVYLAIHISYCLALKHVLVLDLAMVSAGFLLRAMAGGVASGIHMSEWFLLTTGFGSLFMVAGKRYSELVLMGDDAASTRKSLADYSKSYLGFVWHMAAGLTIVTYALWAFDISQQHPHNHVQWTEISVVPWCFTMLRYGMYIDQGKAGEPEEVVLRDRVTLVVGAIWAALFVMGALHVGS